MPGQTFEFFRTLPFAPTIPKQISPFLSFLCSAKKVNRQFSKFHLTDIFMFAEYLLRKLSLLPAKNLGAWQRVASPSLATWPLAPGSSPAIAIMLPEEFSKFYLSCPFFPRPKNLHSFQSFASPEKSCAVSNV